MTTLARPSPTRERLARLPRDTRDTWFVLAVIAWTVSPHLLRLAPWVGLLCAGVLVWRAWLAWREAPLPGRWTLLAVLAVAAGLTWFSQRTLLGQEAGIMLLVVLMALKTLELRARRDALVVFFLGFFLVLTQFLYSQSLLTMLMMTGAVWGWLTALTLAHMPIGRPPLKEAGGLALRAALIGTPLMIALFLLFPRFPPLWGVPGDGARSGLSDNLELGDVAEMALDDSVAMRVRFPGAQPAPQAMYFRGPVLSDYDGKRWRAEISGRGPTPEVQPASADPAVPYELTLEPLKVAWLPLLEFTADAPRTNTPMDTLLPRIGDTMQWRLRRPLRERVRVEAEAHLQLPRAGVLSAWRQRELTSLPPNLHPRTLAWARALKAQQPEADARTLVASVLRHVRSQPYRYTLAPGAYGLDGEDTIDAFWMDRRQGFCEHYASSFVVVMRAMGVPARIVTGYQGTDPTPVDGYWIVRQSHAHAWAEYWQEGQGWQRADPTAAVAPERINRSQQLRSPPGFVAGTLEAVSPTLLLQARAFFEAIDNRWNQWVLGYGREQQFDLMKHIGLDAQDTATLIRALVIGLAGLGLAGAAWAWWDGRRRTPWQRLQALLARELGRLGIEAPPHASPGTLAQRLATRHGEPAQPLVQALQQLQALRYGRTAPEAPSLAAWTRGFRQALARSPLPRIRAR